MWNFNPDISIAEVAAYTAVLLNIAVYAVRTMIPLRILAIAVNVLFLVYAGLDRVYPTLILNAILFPLNLYRLREMLQLTRRVKVASQAGFEFDWLRPFGSRRKVAAEEVMFRKGDAADSLFLIVAGVFVLAESGLKLVPGAVVGEMGLLSPDGKRTQTLVCEQAGEVLSISYQHFKEIYFQNPHFGFYFLKLITGRLFENNRQLEEKLFSGIPR